MLYLWGRRESKLSYPAQLYNKCENRGGLSERVVTDALQIILIAVDIGKNLQICIWEQQTFKYLALFIIL